MAGATHLKLFVTVGTTNFDDLIKCIHEEAIVTVLREQYGIGSMVVQLGHGVSPIADLPAESEDDAEYKLYGIPVTAFRLKPGISEYIDDADIVISHAGGCACPPAAAAANKVNSRHALDLQVLDQSWRLYAPTPN